MSHWKLILSYDGSSFHGWQIQPGLATIQGLLADALQRITGERVLPQGSGRTDAGVHALAQVASFTLQAPIPPSNLLRALNRVLPPSIRILSADPVDANFHARHSALGKTYEYRIFERRRFTDPPSIPDRICPPFLAPFVWDCRWPLDLDAMQQAAAMLCGTHDFTSFAASDPERNMREDSNPERFPPGSSPNPAKTIQTSIVAPSKDHLLYVISGSGFLHHMVRNIVGTLAEIGRGSIAPTAISTILAARNRAAAGPTAPASGLFLRSVDYGPETLA